MAIGVVWCRVLPNLSWLPSLVVTSGQLVSVSCCCGKVVLSREGFTGKEFGIIH